MTRLARRSDRFRITTVKTETGQPVRYSTGTGKRWIWELTVDVRATDDDVYLPYVYNRPVRDPLFGIRQEFVIDWKVGRKVLKFSSHRAACAVLAHILEGVAA